MYATTYCKRELVKNSFYSQVSLSGFSHNCLNCIHKRCSFITSLFKTWYHFSLPKKCLPEDKIDVIFISRKKYSYFKGESNIFNDFKHYIAKSNSRLMLPKCLKSSKTEIILKHTTLFSVSIMFCQF